MTILMEEITNSSVSPVSESQVVKPLVNKTSGSNNFMSNSKTLVFLVLAVVLGIASGFGVFKMVGSSSGSTIVNNAKVEVVSTTTEEGVKDASTFKDTATGLVQENDGKLSKEGTHILIRGDASQNVYLTSSVIDLSKYAGKKVQVWGATFKGQSAGWLMDVGRIKVIQ